MINVLRDVLKNIKKNGLQEGHLLYITFKTNEKKVIIPNRSYMSKKYKKKGGWSGGHLLNLSIGQVSCSPVNLSPLP